MTRRNHHPCLRPAVFPTCDLEQDGDGVVRPRARRGWGTHDLEQDDERVVSRAGGVMPLGRREFPPYTVDLAVSALDQFSGIENGGDLWWCLLVKLRKAEGEERPMGEMAGPGGWAMAADAGREQCGSAGGGLRKREWGMRVGVWAWVGFDGCFPRCRWGSDPAVVENGWEVALLTPLS
jgi:hypothetical protein